LQFVDEMHTENLEHKLLEGQDVRNAMLWHAKADVKSCACMIADFAPFHDANVGDSCQYSYEANRLIMGTFHGMVCG